jgi:hypothetical protein
VITHAARKTAAATTEDTMIRQWLIWIGLVFFSLITLAYGFLGMFSPRTLAKVMAWFAGAEEWSTRRPGAEVSGSISQRIAGFFAVLFGGLLFICLVAPVLDGSLPSASPPAYSSMPGTTSPRATSLPWLELVAGLFFAAYGLALLIKPELYARTVQRAVPDREFSPDAVKKMMPVGRVTGVVLMLAGMWILRRFYRG